MARCREQQGSFLPTSVYKEEFFQFIIWQLNMCWKSNIVGGFFNEIRIWCLINWLNKKIIDRLIKGENSKLVSCRPNFFRTISEGWAELEKSIFRLEVCAALTDELWKGWGFEEDQPDLTLRPKLVRPSLVFLWLIFQLSRSLLGEELLQGYYWAEFAYLQSGFQNIKAVQYPSSLPAPVLLLW